MAKNPRLVVTEIFDSIQGESSLAGAPTAFVRLAGCNLRCRYCDTKYAWTGGKPSTVKAVAKQALAFGRNYVCVTGGEPLAQPGVADLVEALLDAGRVVSVETNGSLPIDIVSNRAKRVVDVKTPSSGEASCFLEENIDLLTPFDEVKYVVGDKKDFAWAMEHAKKFDVPKRCAVLVSPVHGLDLKKAAKWILDSGVDVRLNLQLHKIIWGERRRGV